MTVVELFDLSASRRAGHLAVAFEGERLTYRALDRYANRIANRLLACSLPAGSRVGLCMDRSHHAIAAMLGVLKAGYAFVPLDPDFPQPRLQFMVEDAAIACCISQQSLTSRMTAQIETMLTVEDDFVDVPESKPAVQVEGGQLAYLMYTSGSTGKPKGVEITHSALTNYCAADAQAYQLTENDCTLQFSTLNFDIAIEEIFPPLVTGSAIAVRPQQRSDDMNELSSLIRQYGVTAIHVATAYWHEWVNLLVATNETTPDSIRLMVVTGEKVSTEHYRLWLGQTNHNVLWANAYGPTETTVTATVFIPDSNWQGQNMPIGKPLPGYTAHILNDDLTPVATGETGQLFIGGPSLARGYLNRPDLTEKAFVMPPLGERIYRTGDLARWLDDGNIEYAGRVDHQIKVGSYRIEPGEIEEAANRHSSVQEAVVIAFEPSPGASKQIALYVGTGELTGNGAVSHADGATDNVAKTDLHHQIMGFLRDDLPPFMVPAVLTLLPTLPKTINGKIDRDALPSPIPSVNSSGIAEPLLDTADDLITDTERRIAQIWREVLPGTAPGRQDNFFDIGGTSLSAVRFMARAIQEFDANVPSRHLMTENLAQVAVRVCPHDRPDDSLLGVPKQTVNRTAIFFPSGRAELFGVIHEPVGRTVRGAIVVCPSVGHEYLRSHRSLRAMADAFARAGYTVLRFDYSGTGDSGGDLAEASLMNWQLDIVAACAFIGDRTGGARLSLLGLRVGGLLGLSVLALPAGQSTAGPVDRLMLWDPPPSGEVFLSQIRQLHAFELKNLDRFRWHQQPTESNELFGHTYAPGLLHALSALNLDSISIDQTRIQTVMSDASASSFQAVCRWHTEGGHDKPVVIDEGQQWELSGSVDKIVLGHQTIRHFVSLMEY